MVEYEFIQTERFERVGLVRIVRPKALNALNSTLVQELMDALTAFDKDDDIGVMLVTGDDRAFAAGADIKEMASASPVEMLQRDYVAPFARIRTVKKPVIA